jgi:uncharacterized protein YyaL (SSP411 family)
LPNRLIDEISPYLLQHSTNPVDWYPWGKEALDAAKERDVPILLSIGYSACHWCHVMEKESFEIPEVAKIMNSGFVNIKVDREERPDIDSIYMKAVQSMTGQGGWPLTAFLTPSGQPFYGGTYFPPQPRHGLPSFTQILDAIQSAYTEKKEAVFQNASEIQQLLEQNVLEKSPQEIAETLSHTEGQNLIDHSLAFLATRFDPIHGGFGPAPKFPQPVVLEFLLQNYSHSHSSKTLNMVEHTLTKMAEGGIQDHLGNGFHRYSVDSQWLVPHFEKMLYDNALLSRLYLHAFQLTSNQEFKTTAERTLDHIVQDMSSPEGGFYSALDADSEGEEGTFYIWTKTEIYKILGDTLASLFTSYYGVSDMGNFEGKNILYISQDLKNIAEKEGLEYNELQQQLEKARELLFQARESREKPFRDDKILSGWNGMAIRALAEAGGALDNVTYLKSAIKALNFIFSKMRKDDRLLHCYKDGKTSGYGFLEDYAAIGNAAVAVYEATLEPQWLDEIKWVTDKIIELFWDQEKRIFFDGPADGEILIVRPRDIMDNATPSGNSLAVDLLLKTSQLFGNDYHREISECVLDRETPLMTQFPSGFGRLLTVLDRSLLPKTTVAIFGDQENVMTKKLLKILLSFYNPSRTIAGKGTHQILEHQVPFLQRGTANPTRPEVQICNEHSCRPLVSDLESLKKQLQFE